MVNRRLLIGLFSISTAALVTVPSAADEVASTSDTNTLVPVVAQLHSKSKSVREAAEKRLCSQPYPKDVVPYVLRLLEDKSAKGKPRRASARILGKLGFAEKRVVSALNAILSDADESKKLKREATQSLVRLNSISDELLTTALSSTSVVGYDVARAIGTSRDPSKYLPVLVRVVDSDSRPARLHALYGLAQLGPDAKAAVPALEKLRAKENLIAQDVTRVDAVIALIESNAEALAKAYVAGDNFAGARRDDQVVVRALERVFQSKHTAAAERAARVLSKMSGARTHPIVPSIVKALESPSEKVRYYAGFTLLAYHAHLPNVVPAVLELLKDKSKMVHFWLFGDEEGMISGLARSTKTRLRKELDEFKKREKERNPAAYRAACAALNVLNRPFGAGG